METPEEGNEAGEVASVNAGLAKMPSGAEVYAACLGEVQRLASHFIQRREGSMWALIDRSSGQLIATSLEPFPEVAKISTVEADSDDGRSMTPPKAAIGLTGPESGHIARVSA